MGLQDITKTAEQRQESTRTVEKAEYHTDPEESRSQPWKSVWPPQGKVKPNEMAKGTGGGGAHPCNVKATEGVIL